MFYTKLPCPQPGCRGCEDDKTDSINFIVSADGFMMVWLKDGNPPCNLKPTDEDITPWLEVTLLYYY